LFHEVGHPFGAALHECGGRGVAVHAQAVGDVARGEGGVVVKELRDAQGELVARDLVPYPGGPSPATTASAAAGRGGVLADDAVRPVLDTAHDDQVLAHSRVLAL
jgi:hypothetical protein